MIKKQEKKRFYDLSLKLNNPQTKTYWAIIKSCYSGRKIPIIPSLSVKGKIVTDFKEKVIFRKHLTNLDTRFDI